MSVTQNEKIRQVTDTTMVIGVDIASEFHWARAFDWRGLEMCIRDSYNAETREKEFVDTYGSFEHDARYSDNIVENAYVDEITNFFGVLAGREQPRWSLSLIHISATVVPQACIWPCSWRAWAAVMRCSCLRSRLLPR